MLKRNYYTNFTDPGWNFTSAEWDSLVVSGSIAAAVSFAANSCVLIIHALMTWYRPAIVNRLSLRMIVFSCVFNMLYCSCQLVTDDISSQSVACRALAYVLVASDTMACMCLTMVGLNLVMIFVLKVSKSIKLEIVYYLFVALSGFLVCVVPLVAGNSKGPKDKSATSSCWYHYYFDGRVNNVFNWMWYYGFLLFSLVFAATCAAISIRFVVKKQENFSSALDMFTRRDQKDITTIAAIRKYTNNNTDVFQRIARRCVCYPLVPLISKSWGVGIEIAASLRAPLPVEVLVLDRIFSSLLGFMVSIIYFTDPAIGAVFKETIENIKRRYIHDYCTIQFQAGKDPTIDLNSQYPSLLKISPKPGHIDEIAELARQGRDIYVTQTSDVEESVTELRKETQTPLSIAQSGLLSYIETDGSKTPQLQSAASAIRQELPTVRLSKVHGRSVDDVSPENKHYSIISVTSKNGNAFLPNELTVDLKELRKLTNNNDPEHQAIKTAAYLPARKSRISTIPMRRVCDTSVLKKVNPNISLNSQVRNHSSFSKHNEAVEILVPYKWPILAKAIHWILINIFKVKPIEITELDEDNLNEYHYDSKIEQGEPSRTFKDYTDSSDPGSPPIPARNDSISFHPDVDLRKASASSKIPASYVQKGLSSFSFDDASDDDIASRHSDFTPKKKYKFTSISSINSITRSIGEKAPEHPLRRVSSINVASLQRERARKQSISAPSYNKQVVERTSPTAKLASSIGLTKMLNRGRSMSFSWSKLTMSNKGKAGSFTNIPTSSDDQTASEEPGGSNNEEPTEMTEFPADNSASKKIEEKAEDDASNPESNDPETDNNKPSNSNSRITISQETTMQTPTSTVAVSPPSPCHLEYPVSLSPRPRSQYKRPAIHIQPQRSREILLGPSDIHPFSSAVETTSKNKSQSSTSEGSRKRFSHLFYGTEHQQLGHVRSESPTHSTSTASEEPVESLMLGMEDPLGGAYHRQTGLSNGHTSINFISNWQHAEYVEGHRVTGISEPWDLEEQLVKQQEFAEQVSFM